MLNNRLAHLLIFYSIFLLHISNAGAAPLAAQGTGERKFQRGLLNVAFAPVEISYALADKRAKGEELPPSWIGNGVLRGCYFATLRAFSGLYDIVTAPFPRPADHKPLLRHREFALQHLGLLENES